MDGTLRLRVVSSKAPTSHDGAPTEFGLQNKKKELAAGTTAGRGKLAFEVDVGVVTGEDGVPRFRGPWVHGKPGAYHLYVGWRHVGAAGWINRMKVQLAMPRELIARALETGIALETDATGPAWGKLKDWHGLDLGREWAVAE